MNICNYDRQFSYFFVGVTKRESKTGGVRDCSQVSKWIGTKILHKILGRGLKFFEQIFQTFIKI
jgi:hypothetical protein